MLDNWHFLMTLTKEQHKALIAKGIDINDPTQHRELIAELNRMIKRA